MRDMLLLSLDVTDVSVCAHQMWIVGVMRDTLFACMYRKLLNPVSNGGHYPRAPHFGEGRSSALRVLEIH